MKHKKMFGKIFKSRFGPQLVVSIADRDIVAEVLRAEGVAPQRANMESWKEYRDMRGRSTGLISAWEPFGRADLLFLNSFSQCLPSVVILLLWFFFLFSSENEDWQRMRSVLRQLIMRPRDVAVFSDDVNRVVDDLVKKIELLRCQHSDRNTVFNVNDLFFKYAMEGWWWSLTLFFFLKKVFKNWIVDVLQVLIWLK